MGMNNRLKQFIKNESSVDRNIPDSKKIIATGLVISMLFSPFSYNFLQANTGFQNLDNKILIENISNSKQANGTYFADTIIYDNNRNNFQT
jgi:hypothetical protein